MPRLSEFYGIAIYIYFADHNPPHFHAIYAEHEALVQIDDGSIVRGGLPKTAAKLVEQCAHFTAMSLSQTGNSLRNHPA